MSDSFAYHPFIYFLCFAALLTFTMVIMEPVLLSLSLLGGVGYVLFLRGQGKAGLNPFHLLPVALLFALLNPLYNHQGLHVCFYLGASPITLEAAIYGLFAAMLFFSVICWFTAFSMVMESDKLLAVFGRLLPSLCLTFTMVLRFVPRYRRHFQELLFAQRGLGNDPGRGKLRQRLRTALELVSMTTTWALENAIDTADSMQARGFGLARRSSFASRRFQRRDRLALAFLLLLIALVGGLGLAGCFHTRFFPSFQAPSFSPALLLGYLAYGLLAFFPLLNAALGRLRWRAIYAD